MAWLTELLDSPRRRTRQDAAILLTRHVRTDMSLRAAIVPGLVECLDDEQPWFRAYAARLLASMGGGASPALPALRDMRDDEAENGDVRECARRAVEAIERASKAKPPPSRSPGRSAWPS